MCQGLVALQCLCHVELPLRLIASFVRCYEEVGYKKHLSIFVRYLMGSHYQNLVCRLSPCAVCLAIFVLQSTSINRRMIAALSFVRVVTLGEYLLFAITSNYSPSRHCIFRVTRARLQVGNGSWGYPIYFPYRLLRFSHTTPATF